MVAQCRQAPAPISDTTRYPRPNAGHANITGRVAQLTEPGFGSKSGPVIGSVRLGRATGLALLLCSAPRLAWAEPPSVSAPVAAPAAPAVREPAIPLAAYVLGAIGLAGLSVGTTTGFLAMNQKGIAEDHCSPTLQLCDATGKAANDTGRELRDISTAAFIVGGLGVGLGAYFLLSAPSARTDVGLSVVMDGSISKAAFVAHF